MDGLSIVGIACDEVRADRARLDLLDKLSVAIVHKTDAFRLLTMDAVAQCPDLIHCDRWAPAVSAAALNQHHPNRA